MYIEIIILVQLYQGHRKNILKPANAFYEFFCNARYLHIYMNRTPPPKEKENFIV